MSEIPHLPGHTVFVSTASGSLYRLDPAGRWTRESHDPASGRVRSEEGEIYALSAPLRVGAPLTIIGPSLTDDGVRMITTSAVTAIDTVRPSRAA